MIRWTRRTKAPDCIGRCGWGPASGLLTLGAWVSRDDDEEGGGLFWVVGMGAGMFGSLGPAFPSDDGELSHKGGSMELHV